MSFSSGRNDDWYPDPGDPADSESAQGHRAGVQGEACQPRGQGHHLLRAQGQCGGSGVCLLVSTLYGYKTISHIVFDTNVCHTSTSGTGSPSPASSWTMLGPLSLSSGEFLHEWEYEIRLQLNLMMIEHFKYLT